MPIPSPQPIQTYVDVDNRVNITMKTVGSIAGYTLIAEVSSQTDDSLVLTKSVTIDDPGSTSAKALMHFLLSPDLDGLAQETTYNYWLYRTDTGGRDVFARGTLSVKKRLLTTTSTTTTTTTTT